MEPFVRQGSCRRRLASSGGPANLLCEGSLFCGAMRGCACAPAGGKMPLPLRVLLALQVVMCPQAAALSPKELETLQMDLQRPHCSHPPGTGGPGARGGAHNERPGPATPSGRRLGPSPAASPDNDKHRAQLLRPCSPSPLTTPPQAGRAPLAPLPVLSPVLPDKRGRCRQPRGRGHTPPPAGRAGQAGSAFRGTAGRAAAGRGGARPALRAPRSLAPGRGPSPQPLSPAKANHAPVGGETPPRVFAAVRGAACWCGPAGLGAAGAAGPGPGCGSSCGSAASGLRPLVRGCASAGPH